MPKDPAFLFYPNDWLGGTMSLTRTQKGCYIDLLVAQFNSGPLSIDAIKTILGQDQANWTVLSSKFKKSESGLFFNERLELEREKRQNKSLKQKDIANMRWHKNGICESNAKEMPIIENENGIVFFDSEKEILGNKIEFERICISSGKTEILAKQSLRNYHLWLTEKEKYPMTRKAIFAGFERWLRNERNKKNPTYDYRAAAEQLTKKQKNESGI